MAELLSQLPPELDVEHLVLSSTNQRDDEEEEVEGSRHHRGASDCHQPRPRAGWRLGEHCTAYHWPGSYIDCICLLLSVLTVTPTVNHISAKSTVVEAMS